MFRTLAFTVLCLSFSGIAAMAAPYQAGVARLAVKDDGGETSSSIIWYPTEAPEVSWQAGPFRIAASQDVLVAPGRFPVVLLSHGRQGGPMSHRAMAAHLAREGFIVIAPTHVGYAAGQPPAANSIQALVNRPRQATVALDAALRDNRFSPHAHPDRIGMIGYSAGGYTALVLAGAKPDLALAAAYCKAEAGNDPGSCGFARDALTQEPKIWQAPARPRVKALVLLDPLATMFDASGLAAINLPVRLYRPQDDVYMKAAKNALALARNLPQSPQETTVPGRHFVFVDPCPKAVAAEAALVCLDEPGVDRPAVHRRLESEITEFLKGNL
ncbi:alpha/beta hydrolase family protein [Comamonas sp. 4034]|uniref:alpha/beta hydrolase family protein n=1 Tax=Comamonas sp. 4034 TaxID=3156455 RepID=UPI003D1ABF84